MRVFDERLAEDATEFVGFWSARYRYPLTELYEQNIGQELTAERILNLFRWKNGTRNISAKKQQSIRENYIQVLPNVPDLQNAAASREYLGQIGGGAIWGIFWLHCLSPRHHPIFDQHTYRAMAAIEELERREIPSRREQIIGCCFDRYLPFLAATFEDMDALSVDRALFAYGRYLKSEFRLE